MPIPGAPAITPAAPPPPPPPPAATHATPLEPVVSPVGLVVPPPSGVTPPPTPPVNPAPPGGARREARQRQAATAKSEEGAADAQKEGVDLAQAPPGPNQTAFRRRDRVRAEPGSFTALPRGRHRDDPWTGLEWGAGAILAALALALGYTMIRPLPGAGRRDPMPAPAWARRCR